jgi:hypothetical protein
MEYEIDANTRRCALSGKELAPGDRFYSVLVDDHGKLIRKDYSASAWQGPPKGAFSFWSGRVSEQEAGRLPGIDDDLLIDCLERLNDGAQSRGDAQLLEAHEIQSEAADAPQGESGTHSDAARLRFRYVVALLLMRRKRLKFEEARRKGDQEVLVLRCARTGARYDVLNPRLSESEMATVQEEVFRVLGWV